MSKVIVEQFIQKKNYHGVKMSVDGKPWVAYAKFQHDEPLPKFFFELFTALHLLAPGSPLWKKTAAHLWTVDDSLHTIVFRVPCSDSIVDFLLEAGTFMGLTLKIDITAGSAIVIDRKDLGPGWTMPYSGGKDSALTAALINEITGSKIFGVRGEHEPGQTLPKYLEETQIKVVPWQVSTVMAVATAYAYWRGDGNLTVGGDLCFELPKPNAYTYCSSRFFKALSKYLRAVCGNMNWWSLYSRNLSMFNVMKILLERYPDLVPNLSVPYPGLTTHLLLWLFFGLEFSPTMGKIERLKTVRLTGEYCRIPLELSYEHIYNRLRCHKLFGNNPLQYTGNFHPWLERFNWARKPDYLADELRSIYLQHLDEDLRDRWK